MVLSVSVFTWPVLRPFRLFVLALGLVLSHLDNRIALYTTQSNAAISKHPCKKRKKRLYVFCVSLWDRSDRSVMHI